MRRAASAKHSTTARDACPAQQRMLSGQAERFEVVYLRAAQAYMLISMPTGTSTIFGVFQLIWVSQVFGATSRRREPRTASRQVQVLAIQPRVGRSVARATPACITTLVARRTFPLRTMDLSAAAGLPVSGWRAIVAVVKWRTDEILRATHATAASTNPGCIAGDMPGAAGWRSGQAAARAANGLGGRAGDTDRQGAARQQVERRAADR